LTRSPWAIRPKNLNPFRVFAYFAPVVHRITVAGMSTTENNARVFLNSDMGESLGLHTFGNDPKLMTIIDAANVACGFHSGDPDTLDATVKLAKENGVKVGAHPGLPDLAGFGRRAMNLTVEEVESLVRYQVGALSGFLKKYDLPLNHIKPHGALYGMIQNDDERALSVAKVASDYGVAVFGIAGSAHQRAAERAGVPFIGEMYVDMNYDGEGNLMILRKPHTTDPAAAAERVTRALKDGTVVAEDGTVFSMEFDSVCVHSDASNSDAVASAVRKALDEAQG